MSMLKVAVSGAAGRMGGAVIHAVHESPDFELGAALVRPGHAWAGLDLSETHFIYGTGLKVTGDPQTAFDSSDVFIDFSEPGSSVQFAQTAARTGKPLVTGTSGFSLEQQEALRKYGQGCPMVWASNMSQGVTVMMSLLKEMAQFLGDDFEVEVLEAYHGLKNDAPSGTAMEMIKALASVHDWRAEEVSKYGRHGFTGPRPHREIGVHAIRGGDLAGENSVMFIGQGERLEMTYRAQSRKPVVQGALKAAAWVAGQAPGIYSMRDVIGL